MAKQKKKINKSRQNRQEQTFQAKSGHFQTLPGILGQIGQKHAYRAKSGTSRAKFINFRPNPTLRAKSDPARTIQDKIYQLQAKSHISSKIGANRDNLGQNLINLDQIKHNLAYRAKLRPKSEQSKTNLPKLGLKLAKLNKFRQKLREI